MKQLFGLVICGGKSSRMGEDKSLLYYHALPQRYYLYEMLQSICEKVFLSCNRDQVNNIPAKYNVIADSIQYENIGPMSALLSAFETHHDVSYLAIGCDYPFIKKEDLKRLVDERNENCRAVSYFNKPASIIEPLLAIYENSAIEPMKKNFTEKKYSLRYFLEEIKVKKISASPEILISVDSKEQYHEALQKFHVRNN